MRIFDNIFPENNFYDLSIDRLPKDHGFNEQKIYEFTLQTRSESANK